MPKISSIWKRYARSTPIIPLDAGLFTNAFNSPWTSTLDLRITQDVDTGIGKVILYLDITNLLNLIDDDKGIVREYSNRSKQIILDEDNPYDSQGRYNIVGVDPDDGLYVYNKDGQSSYQWNLGFKYEF